MKPSFQGVTIDKIHYRVITNDDLDEAIKLTTQAFIQKEVILKAVGCSFEEYHEYMLSLKEDMIDNQLSMVAIDVEKNLLVGVLWGFDKNKPAKPIPKLGPIILQLFLWASEAAKNHTNQLFDDKQKVVSISEGSYTLRLLRSRNNEESWCICAQLLGYQYLYVLASSPQIQHLLKQWDCQEIHKFEIKEESLKKRFPDREVNFEFTKSQFRDGIPQVGIFVRQIQQQQ
ncbi:hypothetical protein pb186bvf_001358 [Paramecium bursaria]